MRLFTTLIGAALMVAAIFSTPAVAQTENVCITTSGKIVTLEKGILGSASDFSRMTPLITEQMETYIILRNNGCPVEPVMDTLAAAYKQMGVAPEILYRATGLSTFADRPHNMETMCALFRKNLARAQSKKTKLSTGQNNTTPSPGKQQWLNNLDAKIVHHIVAMLFYSCSTS